MNISQLLHIIICWSILPLFFREKFPPVYSTREQELFQRLINSLGHLEQNITKKWNYSMFIMEAFYFCQFAYNLPYFASLT